MATLAIDMTHGSMIVQSDLLGPVEVENGQLFDFPQGLYGFGECREFLLLAAERSGIYWLQSVEHSALTFLLVDPFLHFEGYSVELSDVAARELDISSPDEVLILAIITLPNDRAGTPTANLQGPLLLNLRARSARQIVLEEEEFGTRCPFELDAPADR